MESKARYSCAIRTLGAIRLCDARLGGRELPLFMRLPSFVECRQVSEGSFWFGAPGCVGVEPAVLPLESGALLIRTARLPDERVDVTMAASVLRAAAHLPQPVAVAGHGALDASNRHPSLAPPPPHRAIVGWSVWYGIGTLVHVSGAPGGFCVKKWTAPVHRGPGLASSDDGRGDRLES
jgi:hypothetical protein